MNNHPTSKKYERISAWSLSSNGRNYSIDPWSFESASIAILDLRLDTRGPNKHGLDSDKVSQIFGKAKFPDFGFVGGEDYPHRLLNMADYVIYPIDDEAIESEFHKGLDHYKSTLGEFKDEIEQLSPMEISEKFGNPYKYGVCRITGGTWRNANCRMFVGREFFGQLSSEILKTGVSRLEIRLRLWNAYSDGDFYPHHSYENKGHLYKRLFLGKCETYQNFDHVSHGIIEDVDIEFSYNKIMTEEGDKYANAKFDEIYKNINLLKGDSDLILNKVSSIFELCKSILILIFVIYLISAIWR